MLTFFNLAKIYPMTSPILEATTGTGSPSTDTELDAGTSSPSASITDRGMGWACKVGQR